MIPLLVPIAAGAWLAVALQGAPAQPAAPPNDPTVEKQVDAIAAQVLAQPGGVGLSIGVARKGKLLLAKGYGLADAEFDVPANAETLFRIGSVTKQFTAAAILLLVEQKKLSLDDTLDKLLPDFPTPGHTVTLRQLLNHTSGIPSYTEAGDEWVAKWPIELSDAELLALSEGKPFDFEPGQGWKYNNTGYYLLGMILAKEGGTTYGEHLERVLFEPLHLQRTCYDSNHALIKNRAQGYAFEDGHLANDIYLGMRQPGGAGGLLSTGGELVRWEMALTSGKVVSPESFALMTTPTVLPSGKDTGYGFGLVMDEFEGRRRIQHEGGIFGFNSILLWLPDDDVHVAVISNGEEIVSGKIADAITCAVLGIERAPVKDDPTTPELRARLAGTYHLEDTPMDARVFEEGDRLECQPTGQPAFGLKWQGGDEFRADFDDSVRIVFDADANGFTLHQGGGKVHAGRVP
ncbi:MAG TPA: serine hydrolase domain-containing protein [Planctomycetota bacterium]|nr:serine hydrolase domain-containing protein [Planctomycetota bacterium]